MERGSGGNGDSGSEVLEETLELGGADIKVEFGYSDNAFQLGGRLRL